MNFFKRLLRALRAHPRALVGAAVVLAVMLVISALGNKAVEESNARKSPEALQFEKNPEQWLSKTTTAAAFSKALDEKRVAAVAMVSSASDMALYTLKDGTRASVRVPGCTMMNCAGTVLDKISERSEKEKFTLVRVDVDLRTPTQRTLDMLAAILSPLITLAVLVAALLVMTRLMNGNNGTTASKLAKRPDMSFDDVVGNDEAKQALNRVKAFMQNPEQYSKIGASAPRGVLLVGPPGTGKTLLAKALAGESKANFIAVDGSYFTSMFYGAGVNKVRDLFKLARDNAPCVLFIDEVDGIGRRSHGGGLSGGESEGNRIINRLLVEMDGFSKLENVVVVAATNHEGNLDEAMRRPGRFDMLVRMQLPTLPERQKLFEMYIGKVTSDGIADTAALARMTAGMSPADIANTVNKAASTAAEKGAEKVTEDHLLRAIETHQLGGEVSTVKGLLTEATRERIAIHEAGHALVGHVLKAGIVERVTIEPRGPALGVTYITRENEDPLLNEGHFTSSLAMKLAGREAELLVLGSVSSGAVNDLQRASEMAIQMVGDYGFSKSFGLLSVGGIPRELMGPDIQAAVLAEARALLEEAQDKCQKLLQARRGQLDALTAALLEKEVLSGEPLQALLTFKAEPTVVSFDKVA